LTGAFVSSVTADVVVRLLTGQSPVFQVQNPPVPPLSSLPLFLILGVAAGLLGVVFNRSLLASLRLFERTARWPLGLPAALVGLVGRTAFPSATGYETSFAVVGMAALFTAIVRAPLTGIVLLLEMTSSYPLMLPLLAACFVAYAVADLLHDRPIYEALLERDLLRGQARTVDSGETRLVELWIA